MKRIIIALNNLNVNFSIFYYLFRYIKKTVAIGLDILLAPTYGLY
jgi:hypothetical protein